MRAVRVRVRQPRREVRRRWAEGFEAAYEGLGHGTYGLVWLVVPSMGSGILLLLELDVADPADAIIS